MAIYYTTFAMLCAGFAWGVLHADRTGLAIGCAILMSVFAALEALSYDSRQRHAEDVQKTWPNDD